MEEDQGTVDPSPEAPSDPERVGRFRILGRLGADGLGVVYEAEDETSKKIVALEVLWADTPEEGILEESRAAAALRHPNLDAIHEVGEDNGYVYLVMDLVEGQPLRAYLDGSPLENAPDLAAQLAAGLAYAHGAGFVHGGLAPDNIFVTDDGRLKIVDLALAKFRAVEEPFLYKSPEEEAGKPITAASDVYAFGLVYHEMLTGHLPAPNEALDPFVAECLATDPAARPKGAALLRAFEAAPAPRWRWPVIIGAAVVLVGLLVLLTRREPAVTTYTDLPAPKFQNRQAATEYTRALQAMRDDAWNLAQVRLAHAVDMEPASAAARLRLAIANHRSGQGATATHAEYTKAIAQRAEMTERDQQLADALEPILGRNPADPKDAEARLTKLRERWPRDLEILDLLTGTIHGDGAKQLALADEGVKLDPKDGNAHELRGLALETLNRNDEARAAFEASVAVSINSTTALHQLEDLDSSEGRCQDLERHARLYADRNLTPDMALLEAVVANNGSAESFHQVLTQMTSEMPALLLRATQILGNAQLALAQGNFLETRRLASQVEEIIGHEAELPQAADLHERARFLLLEEALATGDQAEADRLAKEAPPAPDALVDHTTGHALFAAGKVDDALPHLKRAVASCSRFRDPWLQAETAVDLGDALSSRGDKAGACAAYGKVLSWWGGAKPKSVQADRARAARTKLACKD